MLKLHVPLAQEVVRRDERRKAQQAGDDDGPRERRLRGTRRLRGRFRLTRQFGS